jgi:hypothetical protein
MSSLLGLDGMEVRPSWATRHRGAVLMEKSARLIIVLTGRLKQGSHDMNDYERRIRPFLDRGIRLHPVSNRTRDADLSPAGWVAKVQISREVGHDTEWSRPISAGTKKTYSTESEANDAASWMGLAVLEQNGY